MKWAAAVLVAAALIAPAAAQPYHYALVEVDVAKPNLIEVCNPDGTATEFCAYQTIAAALASITDSSATNKYTVFVHDGRYAEQELQMVDYTTIRGQSKIGAVVLGGDTSVEGTFQFPEGLHEVSIENLTIGGSTPLQVLAAQAGDNNPRTSILVTDTIIGTLGESDAAETQDGILDQGGSRDWIVKNCIYRNGWDSVRLELSDANGGGGTTYRGIGNKFEIDTTGTAAQDVRIWTINSGTTTVIETGFIVEIYYTNNITTKVVTGVHDKRPTGDRPPVGSSHYIYNNGVFRIRTDAAGQAAAFAFAVFEDNDGDLLGDCVSLVCAGGENDGDACTADADCLSSPTTTLTAENVYVDIDAGSHTGPVYGVWIENDTDNDHDNVTVNLKNTNFTLAGGSSTQEVLNSDTAVTFSRDFGDPSVRVLDREGPTEVVNTTNPTTVFSYTVPAGTMMSRSGLHLTLVGTYLNNSGGTAGITPLVSFGGTTMYTDASNSFASSASRSPFYMEVMLGNQDLSTQEMGGFIIFGRQGGATTGYGNFAGDLTGGGSGSTQWHDIGGSSTIATMTNDAIFYVSMAHSVADANISLLVEYAVLELLP